MIIAVGYGVYSLARNQFGSAQIELGDPPTRAFRNALRVIDIEESMHLFFEQPLQQVFIGWGWFIRFWNVFYGTFHFVVTILAFIWLFVRAPERFTRWRNVLAATTLLALVGFSLFPLMPPRLLDRPADEWGGLELRVEEGLPPFEFVDTLAEYGGLWDFDSGAIAEVSNQYAAMPSLHTAWSIWSVLALWALVRRRWLRGILVLYPVATVFCIMVTANHYWLDAAGGVVVLGAGFLVGTRLDDWNRRRVAARSQPAATDGSAEEMSVERPTGE